jgi:hypothetical protein
MLLIGPRLLSLPLSCCCLLLLPQFRNGILEASAIGIVLPLLFCQFLGEGLNADILIE